MINLIYMFYTKFFFATLLLIASLNSVFAKVGLDCVAEPEVCNGTLPKPPISALRMARSDIEVSLKEVYPHDWNVRAIYIDNGGLYVFDKKGNVLVGEGDEKTKGHLVEIYVKKTNKPLWSGESQVYYWYDPDRDGDDNSIFLANDRTFVLSKDKFCPANRIANTYSFYIAERRELYLDGDCAKAIKKNLSNHTFLTYPGKVEQGSYPYYWTVQYFSDPITPIFNEKGECIYYCDVEK